MKKLLTIILVLFSATLFAQEEKTYDELKTEFKELIAADSVLVIEPILVETYTTTEVQKGVFKRVKLKAVAGTKQEWVKHEYDPVEFDRWVENKKQSKSQKK